MCSASDTAVVEESLPASTIVLCAVAEETDILSALSKIFLRIFLYAFADHTSTCSLLLSPHTLPTIASTFATTRTGSAVLGNKSVWYGSPAWHMII